MGTRRGSAFAVVAVGLLSAVLLAGCGAKSASTTSAGSGPGPSGTGSVGSSAPATPTPGSTPSTVAPTGGANATGPVIAPSFPGRSLAGGASETISGNLEDGVEPNCLLLRTSANKLYQLVGGDRSKLKVSQKNVTVDGREISGMATTCQQGIPFLVTNVHTS